MKKEKEKKSIIKGNRTLYTVITITTHQAWLSLAFFKTTGTQKKKKKKHKWLFLTLHVAY